MMSSEEKLEGDQKHVGYTEDYFLASVLSVNRLTASMTRVRLKVPQGNRLLPSGHPDEWVRLALPPAEGETVTLPVLMENGKWGRPDGSQHCPNRPYTVRRWNAEAGEMIIDIVLHEGGIASSWARIAKVGDVVGICNPEGRFHLPDDSDWLLMLTDITGLPAVGRVLEGLTQEFRVIAHIEVPFTEDRQALETEADLSIFWHVCHGLKPERPGYTELDRIAQTITQLPEGPGYIYIAGEARAVSAARKHFRDTLGFNKARIDAVGYWIEGQARI